MKKLVALLPLALTVLLGSATLSHGDDKVGYVETLQRTKRADRTKIVERVMALTDEAHLEKFRAIYREYEEKNLDLGERKLAVAREFANEGDALSETKAGEIFNRTIKLNDEGMALTNSYAQRIAREVSITAAARFYLVREHLQYVEGLDRAEQAPLIGSGASTKKAAEKTPEAAAKHPTDPKATAETKGDGKADPKPESAAAPAKPSEVKEKTSVSSSKKSTRGAPGKSKK